MEIDSLPRFFGYKLFLLDRLPQALVQLTTKFQFFAKCD